MEDPVGVREPAPVAVTPKRPRGAILPWILLALAIPLVVVGEGVVLSWGTPHHTAVPVGSTTTTSTVPAPMLGTCAHAATLSYMRADFLRYRLDGAGTSVSGYVAHLQCGGPDDSHYVVETAPVTVTLVRGARITLLDLSTGVAYVNGTPRALNDYLARNPDGNIFLVTGPTTAATALTAMFHP